jgi:2-hydroxychromene-2-carboxylate isomerase
MKPVLDWYFDFLSPFSYLQNSRLESVAAHATVHRRALLFAGLLAHWGNVGPAEIAVKRVWTFEHCAWLARRHHLPFVLPPQHPFNPLPLLRLAVSLGEDGVVPSEIATRLFRYVWIDGCLPTDAQAWGALLSELGTSAAAIESFAVKAALRANGERAIEAGVFGVPTSVVAGHSFWGFESTDMLEAFLKGDAFFDGDIYRAAREMPPGLQRERPTR